MDEFIPAVYALKKPARESSRKSVNRFKKFFPKNIKIGHFGTLDPFATGLLLVGVGPASRLNNLIHERLTKTYLAVGKLGVSTDTGDYTGTINNSDTSLYLNTVIKSFDLDFLNEQFKERFIGGYHQSPHTFSATKHEGKPLYEWAREGVVIKKESVLRHIYSFDMVKYEFPYISFKVTVSSGTYIRSLFEDMTFHLGTVGTLISLVRTDIGAINFKEGMVLKNWNELKPISLLKLLPLKEWNLVEREAKLFANGVILRKEQGKFNLDESGHNDLFWVKHGSVIIGVARPNENNMMIEINFKTY